MILNLDETAALTRHLWFFSADSLGQAADRQSGCP
jgi:hypothetical protein